MADEKGAAGLPAGVKELLDKANGLLGLGEKTEEAAKNPAGLTDQAMAAAKSFRTTAKWILGAFVAVGVLIFGSLPFAGLSDVDTTGKIWQAGIGLGLAAVGVTLAIWATSKALEPEDSSLGELNAEFAKLGEKPPREPRQRSLWQLKKIYTDEPAHLGPQITTVSGLITKLCSLDELHLAQSIEVKKAAAQLAVSIAAANTSAEDLKALEPYADKTVGNGAQDSLDAATGHRAATLKGQASQRDEDFDTLRDKSEALAATTAQLDVYLFHREMVLIDAGLAQIRGTFRLARMLLALAALLVGVGGVVYATALASEKKAAAAGASPASPRLVIAAIETDSKAWQDLPAPCRVPGIAAWFYGEKFGDDERDGPASLVIMTPAECAGQKVELGEDEGTLTPAP